MAIYPSRFEVIARALALAYLVAAPNQGAAQTVSPTELARSAVSARADEAERAIRALRALGPVGHAALLETHAADVRVLREGRSSDTLERLRHAIDVVSGQRDGHASGLYFHTDLDRALEEARRRRVPVLSLRLLGRLDEELSCANSRYFRTLLYPDETVSRTLRERFVLHVSTERPAPRITIDMGDGRTMTRTITGNSVHYVLDTRGRVIDALPGLYAPAQFLAALDAASRRVASCGGLDGARFSTCVVAAHRTALAELAAAWGRRRQADPSLPDFSVFTLAAPAPANPASARNAMATTISKMVVETPVLDRVARQPTPALADAVDFVAVTERDRIALGATTLALLRLKANGADVTELARTLVANATADGLRNEIVMHRPIHAMFMADESMTTFDAANARIYAEIFRTPASDPWLGLRAPDVWDAIESLR